MDDFGPALAFGFGLFGNGADHRFVEVDVLDLDVGDLDAPGIRLGVQDLLDVDVQALALGEEFVKLVLAQHCTQGGLCQLAGGHQEVFHLYYGLLRIEDAEVQHGVDLDRDVVASDHVLGRHIQYHGAQINSDHLLDHRNQQDQAWPFDLPEATELEYHCALVFSQDAKGRPRQCDQQQQERGKTQLHTHGYSPGGEVSAAATCSISPLRATTRTRCPGCSGVALWTCHCSPCR